MAPRLRLAVAAAAVLGIAIATPGLTSAAPPPAAPPSAPAGTATPSFTVTLVTGDRVHVSQVGGRYVTSVRNGAGRERIPMTTRQRGDGLSVVPADALPLLKADRLDARLFDVLLLHRLGYDDARRGDTPVMVTGGATVAARAGARAAAPAAPAGSVATRRLDRLGVTSVRAPKAQAGRFWAATTAAARPNARGAVAAGTKTWLVGKRTPSLDVSVPLVGAPAAWRAGWTGKGVTLAVLDSGYDPTHPDLKTAVTESKDFTGTGMTDRAGHGTHVASIAAGRGTASGGKYTGVAKGANLAIGKVCGFFDCAEDAILAGMEWAAQTVDAKVVNMSLGGPPVEGGDPLEQAVDYYTAVDGTLFVIAAGNDGPGAGTVGSPGTATAALTVASTTKTDTLSEFSSRGPRVSPSRRGDYGIKPDIAAPGEDIVAARAAGTLDGYEVDANYAKLSGTSMAAPHVAGAAAILAQRHPDWTPAQLKAALMSTAKPLTGLSVYEQGAGRLDVARAAATTVTASTGSIELGYFPWPNADAPDVARTLTYRNTGTSAVTLALTGALTGPTGTPAPAGALTLSASSVTVPAGGTAAVQVRFRPSQVATGLYSGRVNARSTDGTTVLTTALGAYREPESYTLSVTTFGPLGGQDGGIVLIVNQATGEGASFQGGVTQRLPKGDYTVVADASDADGDSYRTGVEARSVRLDRTREVVLDTRRGKKVAMAVDRPDAVPYGTIQVDVLQQTPGTDYLLSVSTDYGTVYTVPGAEQIPGFRTALSAPFVARGSHFPSTTPTPWVYDTATQVRERLPDVPTFRFAQADFAALEQDVNRNAPDEQRSFVTGGFFAGFPGTSAFSIPLGNRTSRTDYVVGRADLSWFRVLFTDGADGSFLYFEEPPTVFAAGRTYRDRWNVAVFGPAFRAEYAPTRTGNVLSGSVPMLADAIGRPSSYNGTGSTRILRDGVEVATSPFPGYFSATVPAARATYRVEATATLEPAGTTHPSSTVTTAWTFSSATTTGPQVLPLWVVRFTPALDPDNAAPRGRAFTIPVTVQRAPGAATAGVRSVTVEASFDRGRTWKKLLLTGYGSRYTAVVAHPDRAGTVSLRATAADTAGDTVTQTIVDAYKLR